MNKLYFVFALILIGLSVNAQNINFTDANLKAKLLSATPSSGTASQNNGGIRVDLNQDGEIQLSEALRVNYLNITGSSVASLEGLQNFTNLNSLVIDNNLVTSLEPIQTLSGITRLDCNGNLLESLDATHFPNITSLKATNNRIRTLNTTGLIHILSLDCSSNLLETVDINQLTSLITLRLTGNLLTSISIGNLVNLTSMEIASNQLTSLDLSNQVNLAYFSCAFNQLSTLDLSTASGLRNINCIGNTPLTTLFVKNGSMEEMLFFNIGDLPNLRYICADEAQLADVQAKITLYGYTFCHTNSYCNFVPGGPVYRILGHTTFDENRNGCDAFDQPMPYLKFNISNGISSGALISDVTGNYLIPVGPGTHTMTPTIENPEFFTITPPSVTVNFPQAGFLAQDFCVAPNGINPNLEIMMFPISDARPGFDASYRIVYKNIGNTVQSGLVRLIFDDNVLDVITVLPTETSQTTDNLYWDFSDLQPFESRTLDLVFNINSPTETPPVSGGHLLQFSAIIETPATETTLYDNIFNFDQVVVNSFDPNDKICIEGTKITPEMAGKYVHYKIRFENTGTANAQNIVVKDMIDLSKFDVNSLAPMDGSHPFVTKILNGNRVEFIFENINLPFADANNDGYVVFKIKTKPNLVVGNSFSNSASIYFDYNFPIVTNTATTVISALAVSDFQFSDYFTLYPNPAGNVLYMKSKKDANISSISVYNVLGQLVLVNTNFEQSESIDVSTLKPGNYFIKIHSDKGTSNAQFAKK